MSNWKPVAQQRREINRLWEKVGAATHGSLLDLSKGLFAMDEELERIQPEPRAVPIEMARRIVEDVAMWSIQRSHEDIVGYPARLLKAQKIKRSLEVLLKSIEVVKSLDGDDLKPATVSLMDWQFNEDGPPGEVKEANAEATLDFWATLDNIDTFIGSLSAVELKISWLVGRMKSKNANVGHRNILALNFVRYFAAFGWPVLASRPFPRSQSGPAVRLMNAAWSDLGFPKLASIDGVSTLGLIAERLRQSDLDKIREGQRS